MQDAPAHGDEEDSDHDVSAPWTLRTARTISKLNGHLQRALLQPNIVTYYTEWCETPDQREPGVTFTDTCLLFDRGEKIVEHVAKLPANNVYIHIPHPLLDPVLETSGKRVRKFLAETFWDNGPALECHFAALLLALRGKNVDRAFWGLGPGGVGQSLLTAHLEAMLGPNFGILDMNIYYSDDEMRAP